MLDDLKMMNYLTKEQSDSVKEDLKTKIEYSKDEEYKVDNSQENLILVALFVIWILYCKNVIKKTTLRSFQN